MGQRRPFQEGTPPPTFCKLCLLGFQLRDSQQPGSVLTSGSRVPSNCLGLTGGGGHRARQGGPAQDDTADQASAHLGWVVSLMYPAVSTSTPGAWGLRFLPGLPSPTPSPWWSAGGERQGPSFAKSSQSSVAPAHNSHAADGPLGNRQSSGSHGSFKPPFLPNKPFSGAVLIASCWQPLGMPRPGLGRINRCAVIFTQQLPALIPLLPDPPHQPHGHPLIDNTLKARPAEQGVRGPVSHRESAGEETLGRQAWGLALGWRTGGRQVPRAAAPGSKPLHPRHGGGCTPGNVHPWECARGVAQHFRRLSCTCEHIAPGKSCFAQLPS